MLSLGLILSKIAPIAVLRRYGMAVESSTLAAFSKMYGSSDFHIPCSTFCLLHISFFLPLIQERQSFFLYSLARFQALKDLWLLSHDHTEFDSKSETSSSVCPLQEISLQLEPDPGEEKWHNQYQGRTWNCLAGKKIICVRITYWHLNPTSNYPLMVLMVDQSQSVDSELHKNSPLPSQKWNHWLFYTWASTSRGPASVLQ